MLVHFLRVELYLLIHNNAICRNLNYYERRKVRKKKIKKTLVKAPRENFSTIVKISFTRSKTKLYIYYKTLDVSANINKHTLGLSNMLLGFLDTCI